MLTRAAWREVVDDGFRVFEHGGEVRPQIGFLGVLLARPKHRHWGLIGTQNPVTQDLLFEGINQRLQLHAAGANLLGQVALDRAMPGPCRDALLGVQRPVVGVLVHLLLLVGNMLTAEPASSRWVGRMHPLCPPLYNPTEYCYINITIKLFHGFAGSARGLRALKVDDLRQQRASGVSHLNNRRELNHQPAQLSMPPGMPRGF